MAPLGVGKLIVNCATKYRLKLGNLKMKFNYLALSKITKGIF